MAKHLVRCVQCGRQFDANFGGYYNSSSRRYTCKKCYKKLKSASAKIRSQEKSAARTAAADAREARTGMRQSMGAMIAKIAIGALFVVSAFRTDSASSVLVGIIIGLALIAWGVLPWLKVRQAKSAADREIIDQEAAASAELKMCQHCGAVSSGDTCEYCGMPLK